MVEKTLINFDNGIKLSIIVPIYNGKQYLDECISSVLNQSYQNWELLLIDDGSSDKSYDLCLEYSKKDLRIKTFRKHNSGQLRTREFGVINSTGDYCIFLDVDDYLKNDALYIIVHNISNYRPDCLIFGVEVETATGPNIYWIEKNNEPKLVTNKSELYNKTILNQEYNSMCRKVIKRTIIETLELDTSSIRYGEDYLQSLYVYKNAASVLFISDVLYFYRLNQNSVSHNNKFASYESFILVDKYLDDFIENENCFCDDKKPYISFCINNIADLIVGIMSNNDMRNSIKTASLLSREVYIQSKINRAQPYKYAKGYRKIIILFFSKNMFICIYFLAKLRMLVRGSM